MNNYPLESSAAKAIQKQNARMKKILEPSAAMTAMLDQQERINRKLEPIRAQHDALQNAFNPTSEYLQQISKKAFLIQHSVSSTATASTAFPNISGLLASVKIDISPTIAFSKALRGMSMSAAATKLTADFALSFARSAQIGISPASQKLVKDYFSLTQALYTKMPSAPSRPLIKSDYVIDETLAACNVATDIVDSVQDYVSVEQYNDLKTQVQDLKEQLQNSQKSASFGDKFERFVMLLSVLIALFFGIQQQVSGIETNNHFEMIKQQQREINRHLENIDQALSSHEQPQEEQLNTK